MTTTPPIQLTDTLKSLYIKTAQKLKGSDRRHFMAEGVKGLGIGGQTLAERELGGNRRTISKGMQEWNSVQEIEDGRGRCWRQPIEAQLPDLLKDIRAIVAPQTQTDPRGTSPRLYTRLSAAEGRRQ